MAPRPLLHCALRTMRRTTSSLAWLIAAALLLNGCTDSNPTSNNNGSDNPSTAPYYIQARANGTSLIYELTALSNGQISESMKGHQGGNGANYLVRQEYSFYKVTYINGDFVKDSLAGCPRIAIYKNFDDHPWEEEELDVMMTTTMAYGGGSEKRDGVEILWTDANGKNWCSSWGTGDQTGSTFKLTEHTKVEYQSGQVKIGRYASKGTFNCTLYDKQGNSIPMTHGRFSLRTIFE